MLRINKYLLASLTLAIVITACGGSGSSNPNNEQNIPSENEPAVSITTNLAHPDNQVIAGHNFTITAQLSQGSGSNVYFSNGSNTPSSVTYNPKSCELTSSNNSCTTSVTVGLSTPATMLNSTYSTSISFAAGTATPTQKISFAVVTPILEVTSQPSKNLTVGAITSAKFDIPASSIPAGNGTISVTLSATNSGIVSLNEPNCEIKYDNSMITSNTCTTIITGVSPGDTKITANSNYFTSISTNKISVAAPPPQPAIDLSTSLNNTDGKVTAGQSFTITATSVGGATSVVNFSNVESSLTSVTYVPTTCNIAPGNPCTTRAMVGTSTPPGLHHTNISYSDSNAPVTNTNLNFFVNQAKLAILTNPESSINVGESTSVGFTIESDMIPDESGSATLTVSSTNGLNGFVTLNPTTCSIKYNQKVITDNGCSTIAVSANSQIGSTSISATANNFTGIQSSPIEVVPGTAPTVQVTSSIAGNQNILYSGQSFILTMQSVNKQAGILNFTVTDPRITLDQTSCNLAAGSSCQIKVSTPLGLTGYHGVKIYFYETEIDEYDFTVNAPKLQFIRYSNFGSIAKGSTFNIGFSIPPEQVPDGNDKITVNITPNQTNVFNIQSSCTISYTNNTVNNNGCSEISATANNYGVTKFTASSNGFVSADSNSTVVPQSIAYVLSANEIKMLGNIGNGVLYLIDNLTPISTGGNATSMVIKGNFLYVAISSSQVVNTYAINANNGYLTQSSSSVATENNPAAIVISPTKSVAYVLNNGSSTISQYSTQNNGSLAILGSSVTAPDTALSMTINPNTGTVYILAAKSGSTGTPYVAVYQPGTTGKLVFNPDSTVRYAGIAQGISISPNGRILNVAMSNGILSYLIKANGDINTNSAPQFSGIPTITYNGIFFTPYLIGAENNLAISYATSINDLYQFSFVYGATSPSPGWNNSILNFSASPLPYIMGFSTPITPNQNSYVYIGNQSSSLIGMYIQNVNDGSLSLNTASGSNGTVDSCVTPISIVVGPNM